MVLQAPCRGKQYGPLPQMQEVCARHSDLRQSLLSCAASMPANTCILCLLLFWFSNIVMLLFWLSNIVPIDILVFNYCDVVILVLRYCACCYSGSQILCPLLFWFSNISQTPEATSSSLWATWWTSLNLILERFHWPQSRLESLHR